VIKIKLGKKPKERKIKVRISAGLTSSINPQKSQDLQERRRRGAEFFDFLDQELDRLGLTHEYEKTFSLATGLNDRHSVYYKNDPGEEVWSLPGIGFSKPQAVARITSEPHWSNPKKPFEVYAYNPLLFREFEVVVQKIREKFGLEAHVIPAF